MVNQFELIGGVHRHPHDVLGETEFMASSPSSTLQGTSALFTICFRIANSFRGCETTATGDDFILAVAVHAPHLEILQKTMSLDAGRRSSLQFDPS